MLLRFVNEVVEFLASGILRAYTLTQRAAIPLPALKKVLLVAVLLLAGDFLTVPCLFAQAPSLPICGVSTEHLSDSLVRVMGMLPRLKVEQKARRTAGERYVCRLAVDIDSQTYLYANKDTTLIHQAVLESVEQVSNVFEREANTKVVVAFIHIWKDPALDPYNGYSDAGKKLRALLQTEKAVFGQVNYDKLAYLNAGTLTGVAGQAVANAFIALFDPFIIAHELGHTFGAPHTHTCAWPGGPLDYCYVTEGNCYDKSQDRERGTIMSYCPNPNFTFHPLCQTLLENYSSVHFPRITQPPAAPALPPAFAFMGAPYLSWNSVNSATHYFLEASRDANFTQIVMQDSVSVAGCNLSRVNLPSFFVRIKASNQFGNSPWSTACEVTFSQHAPLPLQPLPNAVLLPYDQPVEFAFTPVAGATSYELQFAENNNVFFILPLKRTTTQTRVLINDLPQPMGMRMWRVRAVFGNGPGPWSSVFRYGHNQSSFALLPPYFRNQRAPLKFPVRYGTKLYDSKVQIRLATDAGFKQPVRSSVYKEAETCTFALNNLKPNTTYYLRAEEFNEVSYKMPLGLIAQVTVSFQTGDDALTNWEFFTNDTDPLLARTDYTKNLLALDRNIWVSSDETIIRIPEDSLNFYSYNAKSTNGAIGTNHSAITSDSMGRLWVLNAMAKGVYLPGSYYPSSYYQIARIDTKSNSVSEHKSFFPRVVESSRVSENLNFDPLRKLFFIGTQLYSAGSSEPSPYFIWPGNSIARTLFTREHLWIALYEGGKTQLNRLHLDTKTNRVFDAADTPGLNGNITNLASGQGESIWISQFTSTDAEPPLLRFDGRTWTRFSRNNSPLGNVSVMGADRFNNLYVVHGNPQALHRFDGQNWKKIADFPFLVRNGWLRVDSRGRLWFAGEYKLMRFNPCADQPTARINPNRIDLTPGQSTTLRAEGCTHTVWSWTNAQETVNDRLVTGSNQLTVSPAVSTTYRARCYDDGCSGAESSVRVALPPKFSVSALNKTSFCPGDTLNVPFALQGSAESGNQYRLRFIPATGLATEVTALPRGTALTVPLPASLPAGSYRLVARITQPEQMAKDTLSLTIRELPTAQLSSPRPFTYLYDSLQVSVALTGASPWSFQGWDGFPIQSTQPQYTGILKRGQLSTYFITVRELRDANCPNGVVKNVLQITVMPPLGTEPEPYERLKIFPNPLTGRLHVEIPGPQSSLRSLVLRDALGRLLRGQPGNVPFQRAEWDLSPLPSGTYLLEAELPDGKRVVRKIVKH